jgi:hypothetical protein
MTFLDKKKGALLALGLLVAGCAGGPKPRAAGAPAPASSGPPLESVRPSLHTLEDSLVLDLLLGYQEIAAGGSNRETLRRARSAQNQLDYMLRHGGVKDRGGEGRVIEIPAGEKASLGELTSQMSRAMLRSPTSEIEADRAREVRRHRMNLAFLVEDAEWVLALNAAMDGSLPEEDKRALRRLHEAYSNRAPHGLIAPQVTALLRSVKDERLRKELKKLANRSWERERKAQDARPGSAASTPRAAPAVPAAPSPEPAGPPAPLPDFDAPVASAADSAPSAGGADSLTSPDRYCEERRAEAAETFAAARAATGETRAALLRRSLVALDDCLERYPGSKGAQKARGNRDKVQKELQAK